MVLSLLVLCLHANKSEQCLEFDINAFKQLKNDAEESRTELLTQKKTVVEKVNKLKEDWNTDAGREFFSKLDTDWADCVDKYGRTMQAFIDVMDNLIETFEIVLEDTKQTYIFEK